MTGSDYAVAEAEDHEKTFRIVRDFEDNMPDKPLLLEYHGVCSLESFLGHKSRKEDIDNCIAAYESAVRLTPHGHSNMPRRMNMLGVSYCHRFDLVGDLSDISEAILYQQKALCLTPEGHADLPVWLNDLGSSFQSRFDHTGNLDDISDAISYQQKSVNLTPEGHADMPSLLNNLGTSFQSCFNHSGDLADISNAISYH